MCTPGIALGAQSAGAAASTVGAYYTAAGEKIGLKAQANMAATNAKIAELQAKQELISGQREEQKVRLNTSNLKSGQRARLAAMGVDLGSDSAVNILTTTDAMGEVDANTAAANAARVAWGYRTQATQYQNEALMKRAGAKSINPFFSAGSTALTGAGQVASSYYTFDKLGAFKKPGASA